MIEILAALLFAHALADFVFQPRWMVKGKKRPHVVILHGLVVLGTAAATTGRFDAPALVSLAAVHVLIDAVKIWILPHGLASFFADQAAHFATMLTVAALVPDLWVEGLWSGFPWLPATMALASGAIIATLTGSFAIGMLMERWSDEELPSGLPSGGWLIGVLERTMIFLLVVVGQPEGIGFLIAAKSIFQFSGDAKGIAARQYVIVGTFASFGWAIAVSYATLALLSALPELGILPEWP